ncbi:hypothetical protein WL55_06390 [Burkholderia cepacia]|nr:hypothetical protein WL55_06390 [Burkholderia cepacia]
MRRAIDRGRTHACVNDGALSCRAGFDGSTGRRVGVGHQGCVYNLFLRDADARRPTLNHA